MRIFAEKAAQLLILRWRDPKLLLENFGEMGKGTEACQVCDFRHIVFPFPQHGYALFREGKRWRRRLHS